jgi:hypothetical protein
MAKVNKSANMQTHTHTHTHTHTLKEYLEYLAKKINEDKKKSPFAKFFIKD